VVVCVCCCGWLTVASLLRSAVAVVLVVVVVVVTGDCCRYAARLRLVSCFDSDATDGWSAAAAAVLLLVGVVLLLLLVTDLPVARNRRDAMLEDAVNCLVDAGVATAVFLASAAATAVLWLDEVVVVQTLVAAVVVVTTVIGFFVSVGWSTTTVIGFDVSSSPCVAMTPPCFSARGAVERKRRADAKNSAATGSCGAESLDADACKG